MLRDNEAAPHGERNLRIVGENPGAGNDHVALEPQDRLVHLVPGGERNARVVLLARSPAGEQVFVIDEEAAIFKKGRRIGFVEPGGQGNARAAHGLLIGPIVKRIYAEEFLRELVNGVDGTAHVRPGQHYSVVGGPGGDGERLRRSQAGRAHPFRQVFCCADLDGDPVRGVIGDRRLRPQHLFKIGSEVAGGFAYRLRLARRENQRDGRAQHQLICCVRPLRLRRAQKCCVASKEKGGT